MDVWWVSSKWSVSDIRGKKDKHKRSKSLKTCNPLNKIYVVFATVDEVMAVEGNSYGDRAIIKTQMSVCILTQYPYFSLFFKLLSILISREGLNKIALKVKDRKHTWILASSCLQAQISKVWCYSSTRMPRKLSTRSWTLNRSPIRLPAGRRSASWPTLTRSTSSCLQEACRCFLRASTFSSLCYDR